ncbi:hypothetical protein [Phenylobacterium kunshanense]|uniref:Uncharacterized protein n=1 Tax=Phenylobacterium kunshanense TaxID=1445034 RepID=A0A328BKE1_9CAUL|nr:hypothetical protein [Phenylobacterium kunshanense]RAK67437.1 hypothetical protein DJ019_05855 [Phenylobacterium kunshanense]
MDRERSLQTEGRKENAAQPLDAAKDAGGPERYPQARQDDGLEPPRNPRPPQGAGDGGPPR